MIQSADLKILYKALTDQIQQHSQKGNILVEFQFIPGIKYG